MLPVPVAVSEVSLLLYFWPRWVPFHRHNSAFLGAVFGDKWSQHLYIDLLRLYHIFLFEIWIGTVDGASGKKTVCIEEFDVVFK